MSFLTLAILLYVCGQLAVGIWVGRRIQSEDDYLLAGRSLGMVMATFSVFATWFGAETCIGAAGQAYSEGLSGNTADPFGYAVALILVGAFLAIPLYKRKIVTLADLFRERFSTGAERLAVLLMVPTSVMWAAAQIRAFGQILDAASGLGVSLTISIAALVVIVYTTSGGMLADAYTDLIQGSVLIVGLLVLGGILLFGGDGAHLATLPAEHLSPVGKSQGILDVVESWAIPICGSLVAQELIARVLSARSPAIARRAPIVAGASYLFIGLIPVLAGLIAVGSMPGLGEPEQVLIASAQSALPAWLYVVFAGALVSAILSTVDSALLVAGSLVAHNLILPARPNLNAAQKVRVNRIAVAFFGAVAYWLALHAKSVYALVEEASAFGTSGVLVCTLFALFCNRGGARAAILSLVFGLLTYACGSHVATLPHPYLSSLLAAVLAFLLGAALDAQATKSDRPTSAATS